MAFSRVCYASAERTTHCCFSVFSFLRFVGGISVVQEMMRLFLNDEDVFVGLACVENVFAAA